MSVRCIQLTLDPENLDALREAADRRLNVSAAIEVAYSDGRDAALKLLTGKRTMEEKLCNDPHSLAKERSLSMKRKQRSGKSNWPTRKEDREKLKARCMARRAKGLPSAVVSPSEVLSQDQRDAVRDLAQQVARSLGVPSSALSAPKATVEMVAADSNFSSEATHDVRVEVALHDNTSPPQFDQGTVRRLQSAEAIVYPLARATQRLKGDFRRTISFTCSLDAESKQQKD